jgi:phage gpG-like protein
MPQPGFQLSISVDGEKLLSRRLLNVAYNLDDFSEPLEEINGELQKTFQLNFDQRGGLFGGWVDRVPQYRAGERIDTWPLLEKTTSMRESFVAAVTAYQLEIGNTASYFRYHQSNEPRTKIPRRIMIGLDQERKQFIVRTFQKYVTRLINS